MMRKAYCVWAFVATVLVNFALASSELAGSQYISVVTNGDCWVYRYNYTTQQDSEWTLIDESGDVLYTMPDNGEWVSLYTYDCSTGAYTDAYHMYDQVYGQ